MPSIWWWNFVCPQIRPPPLFNKKYSISLRIPPQFVRWIITTRVWTAAHRRILRRWCIRQCIFLWAFYHYETRYFLVQETFGTAFVLSNSLELTYLLPLLLVLSRGQKSEKVARLWEVFSTRNSTVAQPLGTLFFHKHSRKPLIWPKYVEIVMAWE